MPNKKTGAHAWSAAQRAKFAETLARKKASVQEVAETEPGIAIIKRLPFSMPVLAESFKLDPATMGAEVCMSDIVRAAELLGCHVEVRVVPNANGHAAQA